MNDVVKFLDEHQRSIRMAGQVISAILSDDSLPEEKRDAGRKALAAIYEGASSVKELIDATPEAVPDKSEMKAIGKKLLAKGAISVLKRLL